MPAVSWLSCFRRRLLLLLATVVVAGCAGAFQDQGPGCSKNMGICQQSCGLRSSNVCNPVTNCQWEDCSKWALDLDNCDVLDTCLQYGTGYPYTDTCVSNKCSQSYCPCAYYCPYCPY